MATRLVLAVDPGKATGVCLFLYESAEPELLWSGEYQADEFATVVRSGFVCFGLVAETHFKRLVWFFPEPVQDQFQSHSLLRLE